MPDPSPTGLAPPALLDLYRDTHYDVRLPGGLRATMRIGQPLPSSLIDFPGRESSGFLVTACNPWSAPLTAGENRQRMSDLLLRAKAACRHCLPGVGHIPGQPWRESFLLLLGTNTDVIDDIARQFEQNAIVCLRPGKPAWLRVYRTDWRNEVQESADFEWASDS